MNLADQFVPHPIALAMRDMGFEEECFGYWENFDLTPKLVLYTKDKRMYPIPDTNERFKTMYHYKAHIGRKENCLAPTWYQLHIWMADRLNDLKTPLFSNHTLNTQGSYNDMLAFIFGHFKEHYGNKS